MKSNRSSNRQLKGAAVTVALGGGGSRGAAHIGVLGALERAGIRVAAIAGSSIGGLVAAVYALGFSPEEIEQKLAVMQERRLLRQPARAPDALLGIEGIAALLAENIGDKQFEDLEIPLALTALEVISGQEIVLTSGSILEAVLATIAIPGVFPSLKVNEYELVDGGISNPVPVAVARSLAPRLPVIAVSLDAQVQANGHNGNGHVVPLESRDMNSLPLPAIVMRLRVGRAFLAFTRALAASGRIQGELRLAVEKPDVIIRPDVSHVGVLDSVDVRDLVIRGEAAAEQAMPEIKAKLRRGLARVFSRR